MQSPATANGSNMSRPLVISGSRLTWRTRWPTRRGTRKRSNASSLAGTNSTSNGRTMRIPRKILAARGRLSIWADCGKSPPNEPLTCCTGFRTSSRTHMKKHLLVLLHGLLGLLLGFLGATNARAQDTQQGVEVLTRGPIHEAFAEPLTVNPRPNPIIHQKPPTAIEELPPDQKPEGSNIQWIPGYFAWDETGNDYIWISGLWRATPPGRQWMPGHWTNEADGWQWISGYWAVDGQVDFEYLPQPPTSIDRGPSAQAPDANSLYTPGTWVYQNGRYLWRPGFWYAARPDWFYNPASYTYTSAGYLYSDGYWDYPLDRRGMLFAPARFSGDLWRTSGWNYQPRYAIGGQGLLSSLFVRPDFNRYYFGDYYGSQYNRQGFVPWFDHRMGANTSDPLFNYSRWNSRADTQWEGNLRALNKDRLAGNAARPPVTLVKQNEFIQNVTVNKKVQIGTKTVSVTDPQGVLKHMPVIAPLNKVEHKE